MTLLELAERCEKATGPDRELDLAIHEARGLCAHRQLHREEQENDYYDMICSACGTDQTYIGERYTASMDAAQALVPNGAVWSVTNCGCGHPTKPDFGRATALAGMPNAIAQSDGIEAATPALALCAAALRARAAGEAA